MRRLGLDAIRVAAEEARREGGTGRERLEALMRAYALVMTRDFGICVTRTSDDQLSEQSRVKFRALKREIDMILRSVIEEGMQDGSLAQGDARMISFTVAGSLNWVARWYRPDGAMSAGQVVDDVVATLMAGLAPR